MDRSPWGERVSDEEVKLKMRELRDRGATYQGIANILNELGYLPFKGRKFTMLNVYKLMANVKESKLLNNFGICLDFVIKNQTTSNLA